MLQYVPCTLKLPPPLLNSPPSQQSLFPSCFMTYWYLQLGPSSYPYQSSNASKVLMHSPLLSSLASPPLPYPFFSLSPLQRYNRQQILCTDDSAIIPITITKQKYKPLLTHLLHCTALCMFCPNIFSIIIKFKIINC